MAITSYNRKEVKISIKKIWNGYEYNLDQLMKIDYDEFDPSLTANVDNVISSDVIAEKLISLNMIC
jgi:hypothetical protein